MSGSDPFDTSVHNPYSFSDMPQVQLPPDMQRVQLPPDMQRGFVHHVVTLSILTIVQGSLVTLYGFSVVLVAFVMPAMAQASGFSFYPDFPGAFELPMLIIYGSMGGVLGIWAGIRMIKFRGRTFGIVALSSGLISIVGCYCLPTAIGLFVYGLMVLLNPSVRRAFEMGEQGVSAREIQNHFARLPG